MTDEGRELARAIARHNALTALRVQVDDMIADAKKDVARARRAVIESESLPVSEPAGASR